MVDSSAPLIFDISSSDDDDEPFGDVGTVDSDCDWISELFPDDDDDEREREREGDGDYSDDVVVIGEIFGYPKKNKKVGFDDDDDDDCVVLEDDPDKPLEVGIDAALDSDDLVIVGEKGQIACRDYPHARHLCAKFLFASTPHDQHCNQCHCYVCDSLAPCIYWGNGSSNIDHCHSTDQDPFWKAQRQSSKLGNKAPLPLLQPPDAILSLPPPQTISLPTSTPAPNQIGRPSAIHPCTTSTNSRVSNLIHQQRSHPTSHTSPMNKFNPVLVSQQLLSPCNNNNSANQVVGRQIPNKLGPQYFNRPNIFKKPGTNLVAPPNRRSGYDPNSNKYASQYSRNPHRVANLSNRSSTYQQQRSVTGSHSQAQVKSTNSVNSVPCQPRVFNNQFQSGNRFENSLSSQQPSLQTNMRNTFVNPVPPPSQIIPQTNMECLQNQFSSEPQVFHPLNSYPQPNMGKNNFENAIPCQSQALSQPNTGNSIYINPVYSQSQTYNQPNYLHQGNETQSAMNPSPTDFFPTLVGSSDQYSKIDNFPAQDPALSRSSIVSENTDNQYSYPCEPDPWFGGYIGNDGFDLGPPEAANVDTGSLFDYRDPAFD